VKFTTARQLAESLLQRLFPGHAARSEADFRRPERQVPPDYGYFEMPDRDSEAWKEPLRRAIAEEAPETLADLLLRRSSLGDNPARAVALADEAATLFDWEPARRAREADCLKKALDLQQNT
jgi:glycerol-3-phosphate dehydrogenase